jgi:uncharacterized protein YdiU (UPF0061 family)
MTLALPFDNSYARLPDRFFARQAPVPVAAPGLIAVNDALARRLGLDTAALAAPEGVAMLAGNALPEGADPIAQAYAGHQFGGWVPQLGDGRAVLLGEILAPDGQRFDLQLKGAGRTPFSRGGDGRAWLGPVLREYLVSEAMAALGVPTTRALAAVTTGELVWREQGGLPGAVLARVAASHIRVGTFQFLAARGDTEGLRALAAHVRARHYPDAADAAALLDAVVAAQARLVAQWIALGFIHGVMNTDNMAVSGEIIDYGPCAFMDAYHPDTVFSSIDRWGRYAWSNQPQVALWNLAQFASCLVPLIAEDRGTTPEAAVEEATERLNRFGALNEAEWLARFGRKLGLAAATAEDRSLIEALLTAMAANRADFTRTFRGLAEGGAREEFIDPAAFDAWAEGWRARLAREQDPDTILRGANPAIIPRNHRVEEVIAAAVAGDLAPFHALHAALATPFDRPADDRFRAAPQDSEIVAQTFCGT